LCGDEDEKKRFFPDPADIGFDGPGGMSFGRGGRTRE
jgi:hypothetical protein